MKGNAIQILNHLTFWPQFCNYKENNQKFILIILKQMISMTIAKYSKAESLKLISQKHGT